MNQHAHFGETATYALQRAILLYRHDEGRGPRCIATIHDVQDTATGPLIGPGECVQPEAISLLVSELFHRREGLAPVDPRILASGLSGVLWHCPPRRAHLWFKPHLPDADLTALSGEMFPHPHLVFYAGEDGMGVYAVRTADRITLKTPLYRAPYWNLSSAGDLCTGSARLPAFGTGPAQLAAYEKAFFASNFTHPNVHGGTEGEGARLEKLTLHPGGHTALWKSLKGRRTFPEATLVRRTTHTQSGKKTRPTTIGDLL